MLRRMLNVVKEYKNNHKSFDPLSIMLGYTMGISTFLTCRSHNYNKMVAEVKMYKRDLHECERFIPWLDPKDYE